MKFALIIFCSFIIFKEEKNASLYQFKVEIHRSKNKLDYTTVNSLKSGNNIFFTTIESRTAQSSGSKVQEKIF